jgi:polysaccharide pyruvyl transferase WcaK-like protein
LRWDRRSLTRSTRAARGGPATVVLLGWFGGGNFGNDMSLDMALSTLDAIDPSAHVVCACLAPEQVHDRTGLETHSLRPGRPVDSDPEIKKRLRFVRRILLEPRIWLNVYKIVRAADALVVPGTGLFDDFGSRPHEAPYDVFRWSVAARLARTPFVLVAMGAGPIRGRWSRALLGVAARTVDYASYRDQPSLECMTSLGRDTRDDRVVPDVVFGYSPEKVAAAPSSRADGTLTVGVGVMGYYGWDAGSQRGDGIHSEYVAKLVCFVSYLLDSGHRVRLLLGQLNDESTVAEVQAGVRRRENELANLTWEPIADFKELVEVVGNCDLAVVTRFHPLVATLLAGRPAISVGYASKNDQVMARAGIGDYVDFVETFEVDELIRQFERLRSERNERAAAVRAFVCREHLASNEELRLAFSHALNVRP